MLSSFIVVIVLGHHDVICRSLLLLLEVNVDEGVLTKGLNFGLVLYRHNFSVNGFSHHYGTTAQRHTLQKEAVASKATTEARASCQCKLEIMKMRMMVALAVVIMCQKL